MTLPPEQSEALLALAAKVRSRITVSDSGCWEWPGAHHSNGYGQVWCSFTKKVLATHRVMVEADRGAIPQGMCIDHLCRNPPCCNPAHLEIVTPAENAQRGIAGKLAKERAKDLTHCANGHEISAGNTYTRKDGRRQCKVCAYKRGLRNRAKMRSAGLNQSGNARKRAISSTAYTAQQLEALHDGR